MCIVLLTTAHPDYALIVIDNRDEFILRPTSRPHWWTAPVSPPFFKVENSDQSDPKRGDQEQKHATPDQNRVQHILSSRDLQRAEQGTWLGITRAGHFAVLTNYREPDIHVSALKSRGAMVTAWLSASPEESVSDFICGMVANGAHEDVGGFSLLCGRLRRQHGHVKAIEPLEILSNRSAAHSKIPRLGAERGQTWGLSNTWYDDPAEWPKVVNGKKMLQDLAREASSKAMADEDLPSKLFEILDQDTLPQIPDSGLQEHLGNLKESIFIPAIGDKVEKFNPVLARNGNGNEIGRAKSPKADEWMLAETQRPDQPTLGFATGIYGTQRQTVLLVDWDGNVTYIERALWDQEGQPITRGEGDATFGFRIEGWNEEEVVE